jgi:hypothetical protein
VANPQRRIMLKFAKLHIIEWRVIRIEDADWSPRKNVCCVIPSIIILSALQKRS